MSQKRVLLLFIFIFSSLIVLNPLSCKKEESYTAVTVNSFSFPQNLRELNIYTGVLSELTPSIDYTVFELASPLFTDYAKKQRLIKLPDGTQMTKINNELPDFPDGTIIAKTFYYLNDESDLNSGKQIIETRVLIKESGLWNVGNYIWENGQSDATYDQTGAGKNLPVQWINASGVTKNINYNIPSTNDCIKCHQYGGQTVPIGPKLRNLNHTVTRNNMNINQLEYLQSKDILSSFSINEIQQGIDYHDVSLSLSMRGRAYLDANCAHCHNPNGYKKCAKKNIDFRWSSSLSQSNIVNKKSKINSEMSSGEMPYIGTTIIDEEGLSLIVQYLNSL